MQGVPFLPNTVAIKEILNKLKKIFFNKIYFFNLIIERTSSINGTTCRGPPPPPPIPVGGPLFFKYELYFVLLITFSYNFFVSQYNKIQYKYVKYTIKLCTFISY